MFANLFIRFFKRPPVFFPLIAIFHIALTAFEISQYWMQPQEAYFAYNFRPAVLLIYTLFWCAATLFYAWGFWGYIILTIANLCLYFFGDQLPIYKQAIGDILFQPLPVNLLFSFLLLIYVRKTKNRA